MKLGVQRNNFDIPTNAHNEYGDSQDAGAPNSILKVKATEVDNTEPINLEVGGSRQRKQWQTRQEYTTEVSNGDDQHKAVLKDTLVTTEGTGPRSARRPKGLSNSVTATNKI